MLHAPNPLDSLVTAAEAAEHAHVKPGTIRQWKARGHLAPAGADSHGRPLYRLLDVAKAERQTRDGARRTYTNVA